VCFPYPKDGLTDLPLSRAAPSHSDWTSGAAAAATNDDDGRSELQPP